MVHPTDIRWNNSGMNSTVEEGSSSGKQRKKKNSARKSFRKSTSKKTRPSIRLQKSVCFTRAHANAQFDAFRGSEFLCGTL